jgi:hypothetical protein
MKTYSIITFLAAFVAFVFAPLSFEVASSLLFAAGLGCVLVGDYSRQYRPLYLHGASVIRVSLDNRGLASTFELAA